jgi:hypothetical protein
MIRASACLLASKAASLRETGSADSNSPRPFFVPGVWVEETFDIPPRFFISRGDGDKGNLQAKRKRQGTEGKLAHGGQFLAQIAKHCRTVQTNAVARKWQAGCPLTFAAALYLAAGLLHGSKPK